MLTPSDVEQKTFSTALRGYDLDEVDDFLDEVVATIKELNEQLAAAEKAPAPVPVDQAAQADIPDESAVGRALVAAQETADQIVAEARLKAEQIIEDADTEAETLQSEKQRKKAEAEAEIAELSEHVAGVRAQLAVLATAVADRLDEMDRSLEAVSDESEEEEDTNGHAGNEEGGSIHSFEAGKHTDVRDQVDVRDDVESFVLEGEEAAEESSEQAEVGQSPERNW